MTGLNLGDSINGLNSKLAGIAALSWVVAHKQSPNEDVTDAKGSIEPVWIRFWYLYHPTEAIAYRWSS